MDKLGADFLATVIDIRDLLGANPPIMALPIGAEQSFKGVVLLLERKALIWLLMKPAMYAEQPIPEDMKSQVEEYRQKLIEQISETDDALLSQYLEGKELALPTRIRLCGQRLSPIN